MMSLLDAGYSIAGWMEQTIPLGYCSLDGGRVHTYALIDRLRKQAPITLVCCAFDVPTSCFDDYLARRHYLAAVLDLYTRRVVGWAMSDKPDAELAIKALEMAYQLRGCPCGVLFHSDQSSQYGSRAFRQRVWRYRMTQSMSRRGNCWDTQFIMLKNISPI